MFNRRHPSIRELLAEDENESYGALAVKSRASSSSARPLPASTAGFTDHRLRGLDLGSGGAGGGYDLAARRYAVGRADPHDLVSRRELEIGRRRPLPYDAPSALAGMPSITGQDPRSANIYTDLHSNYAAVPSASVAGQRQTQAGTFGARTDTAGGAWWPARKRFGYGQMGSRDTGYSEEWDTSANRERRSGRVTQVGAFSQKVDGNWPWLRLTARGEATLAEGTYSGMALVRITAGLSQGGGEEQSRLFWIGGGLVASFDLKGWDQVKVEVVEIVAGTFVGFAWTTEALPGDNSSLYLPETYVASALVSPTPEGAYAVTIENPAEAVPGTTVTLRWVGRFGGAPFTFTQLVSDNSPVVGSTRPYVYFGEPIPVLGPTFRIDTNVDMVWWERTI